MDYLLALIFAVLIQHTYSDALPWQQSVRDYLGQHRIYGENKRTEACVRSDTGWWGTDITPKMFNEKRMLIGYPLDKEYISIQLQWHGWMSTDSNICLCYKDKMQKKNRYAWLYKKEREMQFICSQEFSMLCFATGDKYVAGNAAARIGHKDHVSLKYMNHERPPWIDGSPLAQGNDYEIKFEFSIANQLAKDQLIQVSTYLSALEEARPFYIPEFHIERVVNEEDGLVYNAISVLPVQSMLYRRNNVVWCFKGGRIIEAKDHSNPKIATMDQYLFEAKDDFDSLSVVKNDLQELFQLSRGSSAHVVGVVTIILFVVYFL